MESLASMQLKKKQNKSSFGKFALEIPFFCLIHSSFVALYTPCQPAVSTAHTGMILNLRVFVGGFSSKVSQKQSR